MHSVQEGHRKTNLKFWEFFCVSDITDVYTSFETNIDKKEKGSEINMM